MISLLLTLLVVVVVVWAIRQLIPLLGLPPNVVQVLNVVLIVLVVIWLVGAIAGGLPLVPVHFGYR